MREPSVPSFCEGGETRHPERAARKSRLLDPLDAPFELEVVPVSVPGRVSLWSSVTQLPLVEYSCNKITNVSTVSNVLCAQIYYKVIYFGVTKINSQVVN